MRRNSAALMYPSLREAYRVPTHTFFSTRALVMEEKANLPKHKFLLESCEAVSRTLTFFEKHLKCWKDTCKHEKKIFRHVFDIIKTKKKTSVINYTMLWGNLLKLITVVGKS